jgi:hypothetical protein
MGSVLRQIYVRRLDALDAIPLRGTDTATACFFSPDGRSIGFLSSASVLSKVSLADGLVSTIAPDVSALYGGAWGADDRIVFVRSGSLWQVPAAGGTPKRLTTLDAERHETYHAWPAVLPGGHAILFTSANTDISGGAATARIEALTLATGERRVLVEQGTFAMYAANGRLAYFRNGELLAAPFDAAGLQLTGPAARVVERLPVGSAGTPVMDLSAAGTLVYAPTTAAGRLVWVSREGLEQPLNDVVRNYASPRVSRDGSRIIVQAGDLWIQDLVRGTFTRLTEAAPTSYPAWTPDARRIVFRVTGGLRWLDVDGSGRSGLIPETSEADFPLSISPDGETLLVSRNSPEMSIDIYRFSLNGAPTPVPIVKTPAYESGASFSPDGQWVAYVSNESGRMEVYVRRLSGLDRKWQVSIAGGNQPHWNPNGKEIVYRNGSKMMAVGVSTSPELTLSQPRLLFDQPYATGTGITIRNYDLAPDGRFVMVKTESTAARLIVISNWLSELTRLVPAQ